MAKCRYLSSLSVIKTNAHQAKQSTGRGLHYLQLYLLQTGAFKRSPPTADAQIPFRTAAKQRVIKKKQKLSHAGHG